MAQKDGSLPSSLHSLPDSSFSIQTPEVLSEMTEVHIRHQLRLDELFFGFASSREGARNLVSIFNGEEPVELGHPVIRATLETQTLMLKHPVLLHYGEFASLRRLLRVAELTGHVDMRVNPYWLALVSLCQKRRRS